MQNGDATAAANAKIKAVEQAANLGNVNAQMLLASLYEKGAPGLRRDWPKALLWYRKAAAAGSAEGLAKLGQFALTGKGALPDYVSALGYFVRAGNLGHAESMYNVGYMKQRGIGCRRNPVEALNWYAKAAAAGLPKAMVKLGQHWLRSGSGSVGIHRAKEYFRKAAELGDCAAQLNLALIYDNGSASPSDKRKASRWYALAADQGSATAQSNLGCMYLEGDEVRQNFAKARDLFLLAARSGNVMAQMNLAQMYDLGLGVEKNPSQAFAWIVQAGRKGSAEAQFMAGERRLRGVGCAPDFRKAAAWFERAAKQDHADAQANLASMYEFGVGVEENLGKSLLWLRKAARLGHMGAKIALQQIRNKQKRRFVVAGLDRAAIESLAAEAGANRVRPLPLGVGSVKGAKPDKEGALAQLGEGPAASAGSTAQPTRENEGRPGLTQNKERNVGENGRRADAAAGAPFAPAPDDAPEGQDGQAPGARRRPEEPEGRKAPAIQRPAATWEDEAQSGDEPARLGAAKGEGREAGKEEKGAEEKPPQAEPREEAEAQKETEAQTKNETDRAQRAQQAQKTGANAGDGRRSRRQGPEPEERVLGGDIARDADNEFASRPLDEDGPQAVVEGKPDFSSLAAKRIVSAVLGEDLARDSSANRPGAGLWDESGFNVGSSELLRDSEDFDAADSWDMASEAAQVADDLFGRSLEGDESPTQDEHARALDAERVDRADRPDRSGREDRPEADGSAQTEAPKGRRSHDAGSNEEDGLFEFEDVFSEEEDGARFGSETAAPSAQSSATRRPRPAQGAASGLASQPGAEAEPAALKKKS